MEKRLDNVGGMWRSTEGGLSVFQTGPVTAPRLMLLPYGHLLRTHTDIVHKVVTRLYNHNFIHICTLVHCTDTLNAQSFVKIDRLRLHKPMHIQVLYVCALQALPPMYSCMVYLFTYCPACTPFTCGLYTVR